MSDKVNLEQFHREAAAKAETLKQESWDRSDTDGFLTQWAHGLSAQQHRMAAKIAGNGGLSEFTGLYDGDRRLRAKLVSVYCKFSYSHVTKWLLDEAEEGRYGRKWMPTGKNSRVQKGLGLREVRELAPGKAVIRGSGTGLSGNAWACVVRAGDEWGQDAVAIEKEEA